MPHTVILQLDGRSSDICSHVGFLTQIFDVAVILIYDDDEPHVVQCFI